MALAGDVGDESALLRRDQVFAVAPVRTNEARESAAHALALRRWAARTNAANALGAVAVARIPLARGRISAGRRVGDDLADARRSEANVPGIEDFGPPQRAARIPDTGVAMQLATGLRAPSVGVDPAFVPDHRDVEAVRTIHEALAPTVEDLVADIRQGQSTSHSRSFSPHVGDHSKALAQATEVIIEDTGLDFVLVADVFDLGRTEAAALPSHESNAVRRATGIQEPQGDPHFDPERPIELDRHEVAALQGQALRKMTGQDQLPLPRSVDEQQVFARRRQLHRSHERVVGKAPRNDAEGVGLGTQARRAAVGLRISARRRVDPLDTAVTRIASGHARVGLIEQIVGTGFAGEQAQAKKPHPDSASHASFEAWHVPNHPPAEPLGHCPQARAADSTTIEKLRVAVRNTVDV